MYGDDLSRLLGEIDQLLLEGVDFSSTDTDATVRKVKLLSAAAVYMNQRLLAQYGGHAGDPRGFELVEQVVAAAFQTFGGEEAHPDPFDKAAMLLRGITQGHPFGDGNKRTGFALASYYLDLVGFEAPVDRWHLEELEAFCLSVSAGTMRDIGLMAEQLRTWWRQ